MEKFGSWKPIWKKKISWKPILKILVKLETFFKKLACWYLNFIGWKGRRKCEAGVNIGKMGKLKKKTTLI